MSTNAGIQKLLEAEHKAQGIVKEARTYRTSRLKASKADAVEEINKYKAKKEQEFTDSTKSAEQGDEYVEKLAEKQSVTEIAELQKKADNNKDKIVDFLISNLTTTTA